jgi:hypothetical protein
LRSISWHWRRMLKAGWLVSIIACLTSTELGSFFFEPLKFHPSAIAQDKFLSRPICSYNSASRSATTSNCWAVLLSFEFLHRFLGLYRKSTLACGLVFRGHYKNNKHTHINTKELRYVLLFKENNATLACSTASI